MTIIRKGCQKYLNFKKLNKIKKKYFLKNSCVLQFLNISTSQKTYNDIFSLSNKKVLDTCGT